MLKGHCQCGQLRYEADATPFHETACHCSICRRTSGAPFVAWFSVPLKSFRYTQGMAASFHSTAHGTRSFCPHCGTPLTFQSADHPDEIDVSTCSLDDPERLAPKDHTYVATRLSWVRLADGLPTHEGARTED